jgi:CHAT domain-containing protein
MIERVRSRLARKDLRTAYGSVTQEVFSLFIDLLWSADKIAESFEAAEQARARGLLDRLREVDADIRYSGDTTTSRTDLLKEQEHDLLLSLASREARRRRLESRGRIDSKASQEQHRLIQALEEQLEEVQGKIRQQSPEYAALTQPETISLQALQQELDPETTLLEYRLGNDRSFLWLVTTDSIRSVPLAPRREIEAAVAVARSIFSKPQPTSRFLAGRHSLCELTRLVLTPAAPFERPRLVVVADGGLQTIPFAALHDPSVPCKEGYEPLVNRHEITYLPSAAVLKFLRRRPQERLASRWLATVANPNYVDHQRLLGSEKEAKAILDLVPRSKRYGVFGAAANKTLVTSGALQDFRIVHFATHGELHPRQPALSFLALSGHPAEGNPSEDSLLFAHEIYNLELSAELVVLSACNTALGPLVPGEGLVSGLARGFMYAGAERVVVSLWEVEDTTTADLMEGFYKRLFNLEESTVQALQRTQIELWKRGWHPFYWAGFVHQGDWHPMPSFSP